jgi:hypothetical protein
MIPTTNIAPNAIFFMFNVDQYEGFIQDAVKMGAKNLPPKFALPFITFFRNGIPFRTYDLAEGQDFTGLWKF